MLESEFLQWIEFYRAQPFDDFHRFHRPASLISVSLGGGDIKERLAWLQPDASTANLSEADLNTLRAFGFTGKGKV